MYINVFVHTYLAIIVYEHNHLTQPSKGMALKYLRHNCYLTFFDEQNAYAIAT